ncbi:ribose 5-phosphate isomerase B [bacterium]|nr:ribose 5-phosphate isomerase B [bacterium]
MTHLIIGSDHGGFELKSALCEWLLTFVTLTDVGTHTSESIDYPLIAQHVTAACLSHSCQGILICGTGIGVSIQANRQPGIRAAVLYSDYVALMARQHNDANVACLGARTTTLFESKRYLSIWLHATFEGGRHARRIDLLG